MSRIALTALTLVWAALILACGGGGKHPDPPRPVKYEATEFRGTSAGHG